jgi:hypothetical protein
LEEEPAIEMVKEMEILVDQVEEVPVDQVVQVLQDKAIMEVRVLLLYLITAAAVAAEPEVWE